MLASNPNPETRVRKNTTAIGSAESGAADGYPYGVVPIRLFTQVGTFTGGIGPSVPPAAVAQLANTGRMAPKQRVATKVLNPSSVDLTRRSVGSQRESSMASMAGEARAEVQAELIRSLYRQGPTSMVANLLVGSILVFVLWDTAPHQALIAWFASLCVILALRTAQICAFFVNKPDDSATRRWGVGAGIGIFVVGLAWGATAFLFLDPAEPLSLVTITVIMMGLGAGSIVNLTSFLPAFFAVILTTMGSLIAVLLWQGGALSNAVAMLAIAATAAFVFSGRNAHRIIRESLELGFENLRLRREAEEKTALLEATLQNMSQGISMVDAHGRLRMWNARFVDLLGLDADAVTENRPLEDVLSAARPPMSLGDAPRAEHHRDNAVLEVFQNTTPDGGKVLTYTDISEAKRRETALDSARSVAEQANSAKTRFLAAASHDLRQPIHALGLLFATLAERINNTETEELLESIEESIDAVESMLNSLLDISKLDAGIVHPKIDRVHMWPLLRRLDTEFQPLAKETGNTLRIRSTDLVVKTDAAMLEQVLANLISNAVRYTEKGRILVATRRRGDTLRIEIYDTGSGIAEDQFDNIFLEFHQLGNPERDRRRGLGLGLAIVKRAVEILGHPLEVRSVLGKGSRFSVTVPLAARKSDQRDAPAAAPGNEIEGRRVLVLDDDISVLEAMRGLLIRWGCEVIAVPSLGDAEQSLRETPAAPDIMIVDYRLSGAASGLDAIKSLEALSGTRIPALVVTGDTAPDRLQEAKASGYPLLHKPVKPANLRTAMRRLVK